MRERETDGEGGREGGEGVREIERGRVGGRERGEKEGKKESISALSRRAPYVFLVNVVP